ncbi:methyltransferase family protein [Methylomonas sp. MgM2]
MAIKLSIFIAASAGLFYVSRVSLRRRGSHGFYRFFAWEAILILILLHLDAWFSGDPLSPLQIISRLCLFLSLYLVIDAVRLLHFVGKSKGIRADDGLIGLEKTTVLVTSGIFRRIRHPMYASLLFLAWGAFCKSPSWLGGGLALSATLFLILAAKAEETENLHYFGSAYGEYMKKTKRFIPFVY